MHIQLQPAYILHTRPYRDTSLLVDALTRDHGRLTLVARGQRQSRQKTRRPMQPFTALMLSWQGRSDLKTLTAAEAAAPSPFLTGNILYSGLYANELLMRLLPQGDAHREIFLAYGDLLQRLFAAVNPPGTNGSGTEQLEAALRQFEFQLLDELGYGLDLSSDAATGQAIAPEKIYAYLNDTGFLEVERDSPQAANGFFGADLLAITANNYSRLETRRTAKRLARMALAPHLGNKPLKSRELFK